MAAQLRVRYRADELEALRAQAGDRLPTLIRQYGFRFVDNVAYMSLSNLEAV